MPYMLNTIIFFQSFKTILKISTSNVCFFTRLLCIFTVFNKIVLNFHKKTFFSSICTNVLILRQNLRILLPKPTMVCLLLTLFRVGFLRATHEWVEPKKSKVTPYLKKIQKICESCDTPFDIRWQHFVIRNQQCLLYQEIQI